VTEVDAVTVFVAALLTALATGLGALPLLFARASGRALEEKKVSGKGKREPAKSVKK